MNTPQPHSAAEPLLPAAPAQPESNIPTLKSSRAARWGLLAMALALAAREQAADVGQGGVVALGQAQNHFVQPAGARRLDHAARVHRAEAGNVFGDRALEQLHVLRQIA